MEGIEHRMVKVNGIKMHVAEKGPKDGPVVLFIHGFPDLWYTWRHQMNGLAALGYRAVAPDLRGYGDTDAPESVSQYTCYHLVGDLVELIDSLGVDQVFLVAHDWGAYVGWSLCQFRPDKIRAYACLSVPHKPRNPTYKPTVGLKARFGEDYYMCRFQEPGKMEEEIRRAGAKEFLRKIFTSKRPGPPILPKENPWGINPNSETEVLPDWFSEDDLDFYVQKFEKTGFTGGLNYYRVMDLNWELTAVWSGSKIQVPAKFITGDLDSVYSSPGMKEYIDDGKYFKSIVPYLEEIVLLEGVGHFLTHEKPHEVTSLISTFFSKFQTLNRALL